MSVGALSLLDMSAAHVGTVADRFGVLGPLEVSAGDRSVSLGPPAQRALLAALVLRAGEVVPADTLVDMLWGARPPGSAANLVQVYVTRLRALLEPDRQRGDRPRLLVTRAPGYSLAVAPEQVDARRFERLAAEARGAAPQ
ncbi:MAG: AfsR/SARP family transcriptional regulator, partial [Egibacteraceae bacterium]